MTLLPIVTQSLDPASGYFKWLQKHWTPVFTGVTTFYEDVDNKK
jgi:hypothetical protein